MSRVEAQDRASYLASVEFALRLRAAGEVSADELAQLLDAIAMVFDGQTPPAHAIRLLDRHGFLEDEPLSQAELDRLETLAAALSPTALDGLSAMHRHTVDYRALTMRRPARRPFQRLARRPFCVAYSPKKRARAR